MKIAHLLMVTTFVALTSPSAYAAPPATPAPMHAKMQMPEHNARMHLMMQRAQEAKTPAERNNPHDGKYGHDENSHGRYEWDDEYGRNDGSEANANVDGPGSYEKMHSHMVMMHQMLESLMVQQQLMMKHPK